MAQDIKKFYTQVQKQDFARQFQFRVTTLANTNFNEDQLVYLETASLPGRAITNVQVPFMGLQFNVPGTATYPGSDAWSVSFRCDQKYNIRKVLEAATFITFNDDSSQGDYNIARDASYIELELLGKDMEVLRVYKLFGAYVVSVGDIAYNLGDNGSIVTVPATLAYQYWRPRAVTGTSSTGDYVPATTTSDGTQIPAVS